VEGRVRIHTLDAETGDTTCADSVVANTNWTVGADAAAALAGGAYGFRFSKGAVSGNSGYIDIKSDNTGVWDLQGGGGGTTAPIYLEFLFRINSILTASHRGYLWHIFDGVGNVIAGFGINIGNLFITDSAGVQATLLTTYGTGIYRGRISITAAGAFTFTLLSADGLTTIATQTRTCTNPLPSVDLTRIGFENITNKNEVTSIDIDLMALNDSVDLYGNGLHIGAIGVGSDVSGLLSPNGAGTYAQFGIAGSAPAATNWEGADDWPPDDDTTYNLSPSAVGIVRDSFAVENYSGPNTPRVVTICAKSANHDSALGLGSNHRAGILDAGSEDLFGQLTGTTTGAYFYHWCSFGERAGGGPWTPAAVNAMELMYIRDNAAEPSRRRMTAIGCSVEDDGVARTRRRIGQAI
jgi:hypothetical protein